MTTAKLAITSNDPTDAINGGVRTEDLISEDSPDYKPIPDINVNGALQTCQVLTLDGSSSMPSSPTDTLNYLWAITLKPSGSKATLSAPHSPSTAVVSPSCMGPDIPGVYVFSLTVGDRFPNNANQISQSVTVN